QFFFSSRRRHTRFSRDWSSDVCSSDLNLNVQVFSRPSYRDDVVGSAGDYELKNRSHSGVAAELIDGLVKRVTYEQGQLRLGNFRSEERRVGKDNGSQRSRL